MPVFLVCFGRVLGRQLLKVEFVRDDGWHNGVHGWGRVMLCRVPYRSSPQVCGIIELHTRGRDTHDQKAVVGARGLAEGSATIKPPW